MSNRMNEASRRYASALFDLAQDGGALEAVHSGMQTLGAAITESADLRTFLALPVIKLDEKAKALTALTDRLGVHDLVKRFVGTMTLNGRSSDLAGAVQAFDELYGKQRGIKRAVVRTAKAMTAEQRARLTSVLAKAVGGEVDLKEEVDERLIGGIQLKIGSQLVDASLRTKLERLNTTMKGA